MDQEKIKKYISDLNSEILKAYCLGYEDCKRSNSIDSWPFICQTVMRDFVLSRPEWEERPQSAQAVLVFRKKYPLSINILYDNSPGMLMVNTAVGLAKVELMDEITKDGAQPEKCIPPIVKLVESEDWAIPFIRTKKLSI